MALAAAKLKREGQLGLLIWQSERQRLEADVGQLVLSRIAASAAIRNSDIKTCLVHDLRCSLVNSMVACPEGVALPRSLDAVDSVIKVMASIAEEDVVKFLVLDFEDAFRYLHVYFSKRRFSAGKADLGSQQGYFAYKRVLFGLVAGPLVWRMMVALVMRASISMFQDGELELQRYVDDPFAIATGCDYIVLGIFCKCWGSPRHH